MQMITCAQKHKQPTGNQIEQHHIIDKRARQRVILLPFTSTTMWRAQ
jgi:hypothetical protein